MYQITTNEGKYYVNDNGEELVRKFMFKYIRVKRDKGMQLKDILFAYVKIKPNTTLTEIVGNAN